MKKSLPLSKVYQLIEPGPVVLVTTRDREKANIMTMSWHMMVDFEPPLIACVISNRNYSFNVVMRHKECVLNIPTDELAPIVVRVGNSTGAKVDKFDKFSLTEEPATFVQAPLIAECFANLECLVVDTKMVNKYNIFILEVKKAWIRPSKKPQGMLHHWGRGLFSIDTSFVKLPSKKL